MNIENNNKGFTLLELLLTITAIGILSLIVIVAINPNKQLAQVRNAQRQSDINTIHKALEQYLIDNRVYPTDIDSTLKEICSTGSQQNDFPTNNCGGKVDLRVLVPTYLPSIPKDPQQIVGDGTGYSLFLNEGRISILSQKSELNQTIAINNVLWTPAQIGSKISFWLDASDQSNLVLNGSNVESWLDRSVNGRHFSQLTVANQPIWLATGLNTKGTVTFDGVNDFLKNNSYTLGNSAFTAYVVIEPNIQPGNAGNIFISGGGGGF